MANNQDSLCKPFPEKNPKTPPDRRRVTETLKGEETILASAEGKRRGYDSLSAKLPISSAVHAAQETTERLVDRTRKSDWNIGEKNIGGKTRTILISLLKKKRKRRVY